MKFFKHSESCYCVLKESRVEHYDKGVVTTRLLEPGVKFLCCNAAGMYVVQSALGDIELGSVADGTFLTIFQKVSTEVKSAAMYGDGLYVCVVLCACDAVIRLPVLSNMTLGNGLPKITRDNGYSIVLPLHDGRSLAFVSEQGLCVSYDAHLMNPKTGTLFAEKRAVLENIGSPKAITSAKTAFVKLPETAPWYRASLPLFAASVNDIFVFVQRNNLIVSLTIAAKQTSVLHSTLTDLSHTVLLLATEEKVLAATVCEDTAYVATSNGLWEVPLEDAHKGLARSTECYTSFKHKYKWEPLSSCMFIGKTLKCSNGTTVDV